MSKPSSKAPRQPASASEEKQQLIEAAKTLAAKTTKSIKIRPDPEAIFLRPELQVFFDARDGSYLSKLNGRFVGMKKNDLTMRFRALGLRDDEFVETDTAGKLREIDYPFYIAQNERMIDFAGPIGGRRTGVFTDSAGRKLLVTDEPAGVWEPLIKGACPKFFFAFVEELLPGEQGIYFLYWLAETIRSLRAGDFSPGQACFFAGERGCGKSLLQYFITEIMGGRSANPFPYLMGENFNKDLSGAEHWMVEDPGTSTDNRTRREFGAKIKEATVNRDLRINGKGKDAGLLQVFRRVTISINNEKEELAVAPPMVEGVADKINLFSCSKVVVALDPFKDKSGKVDRAKLWAAFLLEVHGIRSFLLKNFSKIPRDMADERFGVRAYHDPFILSELSSMAFEVRFLELLDEACFPDDSEAVGPMKEMKSSAIQDLVLTKNRFEAEKVLRYSGQCGSHLAKLAKSHPDRITKRVLDGLSLWTINPPSKTTTEKE